MFRPKATKRQLEFMERYGIVHRKAVNKGEATILIHHFTRGWSKERIEAEEVDTLNLTEEALAKRNLQLLGKMYEV